MTLDEAKAALNRYNRDREPLGGFLTAVLENDLVNTFRSADPESRGIVQDILTHVYWELPAPCWGSPRKVKAWLEATG